MTTEPKNIAVTMTAEELAQFEAFKQAQAKAEAEQQARENRECYRQLVDDELDRCLPLLQTVSDRIAQTKTQVIENFRSILDMKAGIMGLTKDEQRTHTFTNRDATKRIVLGTYATDGYLDTAEDGVEIVKNYITSLASDEKTQALVRMVMKLLAKDATGSLKAQRIVQLRKIAEESGSDEFKRGVQIIEESYQPSVSRQFIKAYIKDQQSGGWKALPLGMTEA